MSLLQGWGTRIVPNSSGYSCLSVPLHSLGLSKESLSDRSWGLLYYLLCLVLRKPCSLTLHLLIIQHWQGTQPLWASFHIYKWESEWPHHTGLLGGLTWPLVLCLVHSRCRALLSWPNYSSALFWKPPSSILSPYWINKAVPYPAPFPHLSPDPGQSAQPNIDHRYPFRPEHETKVGPGPLTVPWSLQNDRERGVSFLLADIISLELPDASFTM